MPTERIIANHYSFDTHVNNTKRKQFATPSVAVYTEQLECGDTYSVVCEIYFSRRNSVVYSILRGFNSLRILRNSNAVKQRLISIEFSPIF